MIVAVVPVRDQLDLTRSVCAQLAAEAIDRAIIYDNGSVDDTPAFLADLAARDPRFEVHAAPEATLTGMWNTGWQAALDEGPDTVVALCNNDIRLTPGTLGLLAAALEDGVWLAYPDYRAPAGAQWARTTTTTYGTYRHGGLAGWCFALRAGLAEQPTPSGPFGMCDPQFIWWCADDDLCFRVADAGGRQVRLDGLGIDHIGEATAYHHPWLHGVKADDLKRLRAKYPNRH